MKAMELKVWVDGVQRIVCGVTEFTTCQEVVIALAQAIGKLKTTYCSMRNGVCSSLVFTGGALKISNMKRIFKIKVNDYWLYYEESTSTQKGLGKSKWPINIMTKTTTKKGRENTVKSIWLLC